MATRIRFRRDTAANWSASGVPALAPGEIGVELDTRRVKIGPVPNGTDTQTPWNSINYSYIPQKVTDTIFLTNDVFNADGRTLSLDGIWLNTTLSPIPNGSIYLFLNNPNGTRTRLYDSRLNLLPSSNTQNFTVITPAATPFIYLSTYTVEVYDNTQVVIGSLTLKYIPVISPTISITANFISTSIIEVNVFNSFSIPFANISTKIYSADNQLLDSALPHTTTSFPLGMATLPAVVNEENNTVRITLTGGIRFENDIDYYIELIYTATNALSVYSPNIILRPQTLTDVRFNPDNNAELFGTVNGDIDTYLRIGSIVLSYSITGAYLPLLTYTLPASGANGSITIPLRVFGSELITKNTGTITLQCKTITEENLGASQQITLDQNVIVNNVAITGTSAFTVNAVTSGSLYNIKTEIYEQGTPDTLVQTINIPATEFLQDRRLFVPQASGQLVFNNPLEVVAEGSTALQFYGVTSSFLNGVQYYQALPNSGDQKGYAFTRTEADDAIRNHITNISQSSRRIRLYGNKFYDMSIEGVIDKSLYHHILRIITTSASGSVVGNMQLLLDCTPKYVYSPPTASWYTSQTETIAGRSIQVPNSELQSENKNFNVLIDAILKYGTRNIIGISLGNEVILRANKNKASSAGATNYLNAITSHFECFRAFYLQAYNGGWTSTDGKNTAINSIPLGIFDAGASYSSLTTTGRPVLYIPYSYITTVIQLCDWHGLNAHPVYGPRNDFFDADSNVPVPYDPSGTVEDNARVVTSIVAARIFMQEINTVKRNIVAVLQQLNAFGANQNINLVIGELGWPSFGRAYAHEEDPEINTGYNGSYPLSERRLLTQFSTPYHAYTYINAVLNILNTYTVNGSYTPYYLFAFNDTNLKDIGDNGTFETCWGLWTLPWYKNIIISNPPSLPASNYHSTNNAYLITDGNGEPILTAGIRPLPAFNLTIPPQVIRFTHATRSSTGPPWRIGELVSVTNIKDGSNVTLVGKNYKVYYSNTAWTDVNIGRHFDVNGVDLGTTSFNYASFSRIISRNTIRLNRVNISSKKYDTTKITASTTQAFTTGTDINYQTYFPTVDTTNISLDYSFLNFKQYTFKFYPGGNVSNINTVNNNILSNPPSNTIRDIGFKSTLSLTSLTFQSPTNVILTYGYSGTDLTSTTIVYNLIDVTNNNTVVFTRTVTSLTGLLVEVKVPGGESYYIAGEKRFTLGPLTGGATFIVGNSYSASITYPLGSDANGNQAYSTQQLEDSVVFNPFRINTVSKNNSNLYSKVNFTIIPFVNIIAGIPTLPTSATVGIYSSTSSSGSALYLLTPTFEQFDILSNGNVFAGDNITYEIDSNVSLVEAYGNYIIIGGTFNFSNGSSTSVIYGVPKQIIANLSFGPGILVNGVTRTLKYSIRQDSNDLIIDTRTNPLVYKIRTYIRRAGVTPGSITDGTTQIIFEETATGIPTTVISSPAGLLDPGGTFTNYLVNVRVHKEIYFNSVEYVNATTVQINYLYPLGFNQFSIGELINIRATSGYNAYNGQRTITAVTPTYVRVAFSGYPAASPASAGSVFSVNGNLAIQDTSFRYYNYQNNITTGITGFSPASIAFTVNFTNYGSASDKIPFPANGVSYLLYEATYSASTSFAEVLSSKYSIPRTNALPASNSENKVITLSNYSPTFGNYYRIYSKIPSSGEESQTNNGTAVQYRFPDNSSLSFTFVNSGTNTVDGKIYAQVINWYQYMPSEVPIRFDIFDKAANSRIATNNLFSLPSGSATSRNYTITPYDIDGDSPPTVVNLTVGRSYYITLSLANGYTPLTTFASNIQYTPIRIQSSNTVEYSISNNRIILGPFSFENIIPGTTTTLIATLTYTTPATDVVITNKTFTVTNSNQTLTFTPAAGSSFLQGTYSITINYKDYNADTNPNARFLLSGIDYNIPIINNTTTVSFANTATTKGWLNASIDISNVPPVEYIDFFVNRYSTRTGTAPMSTVDKFRFSNTFTPVSFLIRGSPAPANTIVFNIPQSTTPEYRLDELIGNTITVACPSTLSFNGGNSILSNLNGNYTISTVQFSSGVFAVTMRQTGGTLFSTSGPTPFGTNNATLLTGQVTVYDNTRLNTLTSGVLNYSLSSNSNNFVNEGWYNIICNISGFSFRILNNSLAYTATGYDIVIIAGGTNAFGGDIGALTDDEFPGGSGSFPFYTVQDKTEALIDCNNNSVKVYDFTPSGGADNIRHALMPLHQFSPTGSAATCDIEPAYEFVKAYSSNPSLLGKNRRLCVIDVSKLSATRTDLTGTTVTNINNALSAITTQSTFYPESRSTTGLFARNNKPNKSIYGCNEISRSRSSYWQTFVDNFGAVTIEGDIQFDNIHPNNTRSPANITDIWGSDAALRSYFRSSLKQLQTPASRKTALISINQTLGTFPIGDFTFSNISNMCNFLIDNEMKVRVTGLINQLNMPSWIEGVSNRRSASMAIASHCYTVVSWFQTTYPGMVYAYDVVKDHYSPMTSNGYTNGLNIDTNVDDVLYIEAAFFGAYCAILNSNTIPETWNTSTIYELNSKVIYGTNYYMSLEIGNINNIPSETSVYWKLFSPTIPRLCWSDNLFNKYNYTLPYFRFGVTGEGVDYGDQTYSSSSKGSNAAGDYYANMCKNSLDTIVRYYGSTSDASDFPIDCIAFPMHLSIQDFIKSPEETFAGDSLTWSRRSQFFKNTNKVLYNRCLLFQNVGGGIIHSGGKDFTIDFSEFDVALYRSGDQLYSGGNSAQKPGTRIVASTYWDKSGEPLTTYPLFRIEQYNFLKALQLLDNIAALNINKDYFSFGQFYSINTGTTHPSANRTAILFESDSSGGTLETTKTYDTFKNDVYDSAITNQTITSHKVAAVLIQYGETENSISTRYATETPGAFNTMLTRIINANLDFTSNMSILIGNLNIDFIGRSMHLNTATSGRNYILMKALENYNFGGKNVRTVSSIGLRSMSRDLPVVSNNNQLLIFSARSNRLFGLRYFNAFLNSITTGSINTKKYPTYSLEPPSANTILPYLTTTEQGRDTKLYLSIGNMSYLTTSMPVGYMITGNIITSANVADGIRVLKAFLPIYSYSNDRATAASPATPNIIVPYLIPSVETTRFLIGNTFPINIGGTVTNCQALSSEYVYVNNVDDVRSVLSGDVSRVYNGLSDLANINNTEGISVVIKGVYYNPNNDYYVVSDNFINPSPVVCVDLIRNFNKTTSSLQFDILEPVVREIKFFSASSSVIGFNSFPANSYVIAHPSYSAVVVVGTVVTASATSIPAESSTYRDSIQDGNRNHILGTDSRSFSEFSSNAPWSYTSTADNMGLFTILTSKLDWFLFYTRGRYNTARGTASPFRGNQFAGIGTLKSTLASSLYDKDNPTQPPADYYLFINNAETFIRTKVHNMLPNTTYLVTFWMSVSKNKVPTEKAGTYNIPAGTRFPIIITNRSGVVSTPIHTQLLAFTSPTAGASNTIFLHSSAADWNGGWKGFSFRFSTTGFTFPSAGCGFLQFGPLPEAAMINTSFNFTAISVTSTTISIAPSIADTAGSTGDVVITSSGADTNPTRLGFPFDATGAPTPIIAPPPVGGYPGYDIFIIVGQSNAQGSGTRNTGSSLYGAIETYPNGITASAASIGTDDPWTSIKMLKNDGTIVNAQHPISCIMGYYNQADVARKTFSAASPNSSSNCNKVGFGLSFAKYYQQNYNSKSNANILIINCSYGGTSVTRTTSYFNWGILSHTYNSSGNVTNYSLVQLAIEKINSAALQIGASSRVKAILWHQGESDAASIAGLTPPLIPFATYASMLNTSLTTIRSAISTTFSNSTNVPILVGGLCFDTFRNRITGSVNTTSSLYTMNNNLSTLPNTISNCKFVRTDPWGGSSPYTTYLEGDNSTTTTIDPITGVTTVTFDPPAAGVSNYGQGNNTGKIHFSATSQRELGRRFYTAFST